MEKLREISPEEKERIEEVLRHFFEEKQEVLFAYLYGSFGEGRFFHDIDIGVFVEKSKVPKEDSLTFEISISIELEELIKIPVDVKVINFSPLSYKYEVIKCGKLILTKDDEKRVEFETSTVDYYFDFAPYLNRYLKEVLDIGD